MSEKANSAYYEYRIPLVIPQKLLQENITP